MTYVRPSWARFFPESPGKSLLLAAGISGALGILDVAFIIYVVRDYGLTLFIAVPCALGVAAPLVHGIGAPRSFGQCIAAAILCQVAMFGGMLVFAMEGLICIVMAAPLWMTVAIVGAMIAYPIHRRMWRNYVSVRGFPVVILMLAGLIPLLAGAERVGSPEPPMLTLTTTVVIDAPPEVVWRHLLAYPDMATPAYWPFRVGMAAPLRAELVGTGLGATRYCVFTTGRAQETITQWEPPTNLAFLVLNTPPPMVEWSPYGGIHPPHLEGYLESKAARFELRALPGGRTELTGTSWYQNGLFPAAYWRLWSDAIIKDVHLSVFAHVKELSEADLLTRGGIGGAFSRRRGG